MSLAMFNHTSNLPQFNSIQFNLMTRGTDKTDDLIASISRCNESVMIDGFGSSANEAAGKCHLVSVYQTCQEDPANDVRHFMHVIVISRYIHG
jgi:hypothetical protein